MKELLKYIKDYKKECVLGPLFKLLEACFDLTVPIVMAKIIDEGIAKSDSHFITCLRRCPDTFSSGRTF